jgi:hypothetical protein
MSAYRDSYRRVASGHTLTLVAMMQAIALERLVEQLSDLRGADATGADLIGCLSVALVVLEGIVIIWLLYAHLFCVLEWVPIRAEAITPFSFGLMQLLAIAMIEPETVWAAALLYGLNTVGATVPMRRWVETARRVEGNAAALDSLPIRRITSLTYLISILCLLAALLGFWSTAGLAVVGGAAAFVNASILASWVAGWWRSVEAGTPAPA